MQVRWTRRSTWHRRSVGALEACGGGVFMPRSLAYWTYSPWSLACVTWSWSTSHFEPTCVDLGCL
jgi:hypothetical protein